MPVFKVRTALTGMQVREAMQKMIKRLSENTLISNCVRTIIKMKSSIVLVDGIDGTPCGVVTKTDIMNAYYAGLPSDSPLQDIMIGPLLFCYPDDRIEEAIHTMQQDGINRIFVCGADSAEIIGTLDCSDIIGLLYRYCRICEKSKWKSSTELENNPPNLKVKDAMVTETASCHEDETILAVIEKLAALSMGAMLIVDSKMHPRGVITKTDLNLAYINGISPEQPAKSIMNSPVDYCESNTSLAHAIQQMLISDVQQLFVRHPGEDIIAGQLTISGAARHRSGTCKACITSLMLEKV